jgi:DNA-binding MarR family transcriptional regulator
MKNENYINIQGWMINELNLKGNELILFAIIYGFSQDNESEYFGSQRYISKALKISLPTVNELINKLLDKKFIIKTSESHYKVNVKESLTVLKKVKQGCLRKFNDSVKESLTNNNTINKTNNKSIAKANANNLGLLVNIYKEKGIDIPNTIFSNKTERKSADELIRLKGENKISNMLDYCLSLLEETKQEEKRFILRFDTPYHLLKNYEAIKMKM